MVGWKDEYRILMGNILENDMGKTKKKEGEQY
jgi:hypothetical protein